MKRGIRSWEIILCVLVLAVIVAGLFLPKTGSFVMADEICDVLVVWIVCAYIRPGERYIVRDTDR